MSKVKISGLQLVTIVANVVFGKAIGFTGGVLARVVDRDAWISMSLAFAEGLVVVCLVVWLMGRFRGEPLDAVVQRLLGKWLGRLVLLLLAAYFAVAFVTSAITLTLHINDYLMTETPLVIFVVLYTLLCMYGVYMGLEVAARLSIFGLLFAMTINFLMAIGSVDHFELARLLPMMDQGAGKVTAASLVAAQDVTMATSAVLLLLPTVKNGKWLSYSCWGLVAGAVLVVIWPLFEVGVLGAEVTGQYLISCMQLARAAELGIYLHRYDLLMVIVFAYSVCTQSIICLYGAVECTAAAIPWRKLRRPWLIWGLGLVSMIIHYYMAYDREWYGMFLSDIWPVIAVPLAWGLPLLLCLVALLRPGLRRAGKPTHIGEPTSG